jgi:hypothetical protein
MAVNIGEGVQVFGKIFIASGFRCIEYLKQFGKQQNLEKKYR